MEIKLSETSGVPFYRQLTEQIMRMIKSGQLSPGEKLPSVRELAASSLVSLITVRRAYADLEAERLIVRRQGQGTFVSEEAVEMTQEQRLAEGRVLFRKAFVGSRELGLVRDEVEALVQEGLDGWDSYAKGGEDVG